MEKKYLQVEIKTSFLVQFDLINKARGVSPEQTIEKWIRRYVEENKELMRLYEDDEIEQYDMRKKRAREKLRVKLDAQLDNNISEAGRFFILWNKENNYNSETFDRLAGSQALDEELMALPGAEEWAGSKKDEWEKWLTANSSGFPYDKDFRTFGLSIFKNKTELDSYLEYCRANSRKNDATTEKLLYFPGAEQDKDE